MSIYRASGKRSAPSCGFAGNLSGGSFFGGFQSSGDLPRPYGSAEISFLLGVGLESLTGSTGTGQIYLGVGVQYETAQYDSADTAASQAGAPEVPPRRGMSLKLRMPFYLIPFDLLLAAPILIWAAPEAFTDMSIVAASGGLLGLHRALVTNLGAFQLLLGREIGVTAFGYIVSERLENVAAIPPEAVVSYGVRSAFISYRSFQIEMPVFEYRPLRTFATKQALTFAFQLGGGVELPNDVKYVSKLSLPAATGPTPDLTMAWFAYLRIHFDGRYYF